VAANASPQGRVIEMKDRVAERDALDGLVLAVRAGESRSLVVRGDPGVGKTVLLDYLAGQAHGCRIARMTGVQSETPASPGLAGVSQLADDLAARSRLTAIIISAGHVPEPIMRPRRHCRYSPAECGPGRPLPC
jgi:ABC-type molybdenum transport system ATPase subunit/photorepair protein PhrA